MNRNLLTCVVLAAIVRLTFLAYSEIANPNPVWSLDSRHQLQAADGILAGESDQPPYVDDVGLRYVLVLLSPFGGASLFRLQLLQVFLDSLLVAVAWRIGMLLGGLVTARLAAFLYAAFLPQVVLAVVPGYDGWATWALMLPTWLLLEGLDTTRGRVAVCGFSAGFINNLLGIIRSTTTFFAPFTAVVLLCYGRRRLSAFVMTGWLVVMLPLAAYNRSHFGEVRPIRGGWAHMFWAGVGQFANDYGIQSTDQSVYALYHRLSGKTNYNSQESDAVLASAALNYLRDHPGHYMMSVPKRGFGIVFPKNYWGPWADEFHPHYRDLLQTFARSPFEFALNYPVTAFLGVAGRIMDWLVLPIGAIWGILALWKRPQAVVFLPFLYTLATLAPVYVTPRNTTNAYAAILPLCSFGLVRLAVHLVPLQPRSGERM
ncbi:MAG TPA: hypothetical protein VE422_34080 [Terriglobia bacterium]|nr:hypothetical protein [Terriglobia bacterium]